MLSFSEVMKAANQPQILLSFGIQALIAVIVSFYTAYLEIWGPFSGQEGLNHRARHADLVSRMRDMNIPPELQMSVNIWNRNQIICREILLQGSDVQVITGEWKISLFT